MADRLQGQLGSTCQLTAFEHRILLLRSRGMTRQQIAAEVKRSPQTISNCLTVAKEKLGADTLMEAALLMLGATALG